MIQYLDEDNGWIDIDENVDFSNALIRTTRIDDAFESGTVKAYLTRSTPIPPYTQIKINNKGYVVKLQSIYPSQTHMFMK